MSQDRERTIVGGGLAGLSLALALLERGVDGARLTVIDSGDRRRGSDTPSAMLHAFPGRSMGLRRGQGEAFVRSWEWITGWAEEVGGEWLQEGTMVRPLTEDDRGERLKRSWEKWRDDYPQLIRAEVMDPEEAKAAFPGLTPTTPVLAYSPAATVVLPGLMVSLQEALKSRGVRFISDEMVELSAEVARGWRLVLAGQEIWHTEEVVLAMGASLDSLFPGLDLRRKAGEVLLLDPKGRELPALVNGRKHLFPRPDGLWGLSSTYFPVSQWDDRDDREVIEELKSPVEELVPAVKDAEVLDLWRGERGIFGSDHMPLVGPVPDVNGLFCFASFGSKGLLWTPAAAAALAAHLCGDADAISAYMDTRRLNKKKWRGVL